MRSTLVKLWDTLRSSYWVVPTLMAAGAMVLAFVLTSVDEHLGASWLLDRFTWLHANQPDGARAVLSTVAGSMITVAGVTFSITIATVAFVSSAYGPRILTNFMEDRGNQFTLGTFIATFLYCLLVLRTVRSAGEGDVSGGMPGGFVPHLALLCGVLLGIMSLGVLIYFIHHITESIHVSNIVARIGGEVRYLIDGLRPEASGAAHAEAPLDHLPPGFAADATAVATREDGYIHNLDEEGLIECARAHDLVVRNLIPPGRFALAGEAVFLAWPPARVTDAVRAELAEKVAQGRRRTKLQDPLFPVDELVEIAARALSPGINDPFTAMNCINWLGAGFIRLCRQPSPEPLRYDAEGHLRLVLPTVTPERYAQAFFDQLIPYAAADRNAAIHLMTMLRRLMNEVEEEAHRDLLEGRARALRDAIPVDELGDAR